MRKCVRANVYVCAKVRPAKVYVCICVCVYSLIYSRSRFPLREVFSQFSLSLILTDIVQLFPGYKKKTFLSRLLFEKKKE